MQLNETEKKILGEFLDRLSDHMGNAGCNDYDLPDSPEGWELAKEVAASFPDSPPVEPTLLTYDWAVLNILCKKLGV